jgi:hypothetical protein
MWLSTRAVSGLEAADRLVVLRAVGEHEPQRVETVGVFRPLRVGRANGQRAPRQLERLGSPGLATPHQGIDEDVQDPCGRLGFRAVSVDGGTEQLPGVGLDPIRRLPLAQTLAQGGDRGLVGPDGARRDGGRREEQQRRVALQRGPMPQNPHG